MELKTCCTELFGYLRDVNLFTFKFHIPNYNIDDISKIRDLSYLNASHNEHFNITIKKVIKMTSMRKNMYREQSC